MLTIKRGGLLMALTMVGLLVMAPLAGATTYSDRGAGILIWPIIEVDRAADIDTLVDVTNARTDDLVAAHCFYVNANSHCSNTGLVCEDDSDCVTTESVGSCTQGWNEIDFNIVLTQNQPLVWSAAEGLSGSQLPCPRNGECRGANQSNAGTRVPGVPEEPFLGELKCVEVDPELHEPIAANDLTGTAEVQFFQVVAASGGAPAGQRPHAQPPTGQAPPVPEFFGADPGKYNAVGIRAMEGVTIDGTDLNIGGPDAEYEPCPQVLIVNHLFDFAADPLSSNLPDDVPGPYFSITELALVPCSEDFLTQNLTPVTAQFLVYNEFEQRFSTSRQVRCLLNSILSEIDTTQPERSIFSAFVAGTVAGQTRIQGVNGGLVGAAQLFYEREGEGFGQFGTGDYNIHQQGDRADADIIRVP